MIHIICFRSSSSVWSPTCLLSAPSHLSATLCPPAFSPPFELDTELLLPLPVGRSFYFIWHPTRKISTFSFSRPLLSLGVTWHHVTLPPDQLPSITTTLFGKRSPPMYKYIIVLRSPSRINVWCPPACALSPQCSRSLSVLTNAPAFDMVRFYGASLSASRCVEGGRE